ncbi:MAG: hypothetical protein U0Y08_13655 [Bacteroidia bacterium]
MKRPLLVLLLLLIARIAQSQETVNTSILLIPYQPEFYLSDAERDIMAQSTRTPEEYRAYFRKVLDLKLMAELETIGPVYSMLQDTSAAGRKDLQRYFGSTGFSYADPVGPRVPDKKEIRKEDKKYELFNNQHAAPQTITTRGDTKYMQAIPGDTAFFSALAAKHHSGLIISINQFEIKTNYNSCIDIANKVYRRELILHYSIFLPNGKQIRGNYLMEFFPSNSNREQDIAEKCFPLLAAQMKKQAEEALGIKTGK